MPSYAIIFFSWITPPSPPISGKIRAPNPGVWVLFFSRMCVGTCVLCCCSSSSIHSPENRRRQHTHMIHFLLSQAVKRSFSILQVQGNMFNLNIFLVWQILWGQRIRPRIKLQKSFWFFSRLLQSHQDCTSYTGSRIALHANFLHFSLFPSLCLPSTCDSTSSSSSSIA